MFQPVLPVSIQTMVIQYNGIKIYYPQVVGLVNLAVQQKINKKIYETVQALWQNQFDQQGADKFQEMLGTFEIKTNERNVLSLLFTNYAYAAYHAHGLTLVKSLNFDVKTGKNYQLHELFQSNSDYKKVLTRNVKQQIQERNIDVFEDKEVMVSSNQDYYIADKALVLFYQLYEITPYYVGIPMFPISVYELEDIIRKGTPLERMLSSL